MKRPAQSCTGLPAQSLQVLMEWIGRQKLLNRHLFNQISQLKASLIFKAINGNIHTYRFFRLLLFRLKKLDVHGYNSISNFS